MIGNDRTATGRLPASDISVLWACRREVVLAFAEILLLRRCRGAVAETHSFIQGAVVADKFEAHLAGWVDIARWLTDTVGVCPFKRP